jgi:hypothetical protein
LACCSNSGGLEHKGEFFLLLHFGCESVNLSLGGSRGGGGVLVMRDADE